ncbi:MAG: hypothetical protein IT378_00955 [Sandaracinaceae bacterium]|nr:hypothetical protein [Sandaracinaceae bacterium]
MIGGPARSSWLGASPPLRRLWDRGLLALHAAEPNSYHKLGPKALLPVDGQGLDPDRPEPTSDRPESGPDRPELTADRPELPPDLAASVMVAERRLRRLFPDEPTHPNQAYAAPLANDEKSPT